MVLVGRDYLNQLCLTQGQRATVRRELGWTALWGRRSGLSVGPIRKDAIGELGLSAHQVGQQQGPFGGFLGGGRSKPSAQVWSP